MLLEELDKAVQSVEKQTHKLAVIDRETAVEAIQQSDRFQLVNVSKALATALIPLRGNVRSRQLEKSLERLVNDSDKTVVLDRIELLFEPSLKTLPLQLLKKLSRSTVLIVLWPGSINNRQLTYAQPMHAEYQSYSSDDLNDVLVIAPDHP